MSNRKRRPMRSKHQRVQVESEKSWFDEYNPLKLPGKGLTQPVLSSVDAKALKKLLKGS